MGKGTEQLDFAMAITRTVQVFAETMTREQCREAAERLRALDGTPECRAFYAGMALTLDELLPRTTR